MLLAARGGRLVSSHRFRVEENDGDLTTMVTTMIELANVKANQVHEGSSESRNPDLLVDSYSRWHFRMHHKSPAATLFTRYSSDWKESR